MLAELPAEHVPGPPPLASGVRHDDRLLKENISVSHNRGRIFFTF